MPIAEPDTDPGRTPLAVGRRFYQVAVARLAEVQEPLGLRPLEFGVILRLQATPGLDQVTLGEQMVLDRTTIGGLVRHLERLGYVTRAISKNDRRARVLTLTARGKALHKEHRPHAMTAQESMLAVLTPAERTSLIDLMSRVVEANRTYLRPGAGRRPRLTPQARATRAPNGKGR
jgi:DNA-binding MarR family transcriptional regulator